MSHLITLDVDWAQDWMIEHVANILIDKQIKATWFITHDSPAIQNLKKYPKLFELGIHPNFDADTTQGKNIEDIIVHLMSIAGNPESVRMHRYSHSEPLLHTLRKFDFLYDSTMLCPYVPLLYPHRLYFEDGTYIIRLPAYFEDYQELLQPDKSFDSTLPKFNLNGMKVMIFHPIHIALNTNSIYDYTIKKNAKMIVSACDDKEGIGTLFENLTTLISETDQYTIMELAQQWNVFNE